MEFDDTITTEKDMKVDVNVGLPAMENTATLDVQQAHNMDVADDEETGEKQFVNRVTSYPVVASTIGKVLDMYSHCKDSSDLVKYSLETAEHGVKYVSSSVAPVMTKLETPLSAVNSVACCGLDVMEHSCPIITKPTEEVIAETKNAYETNVKPSVDKVAGIGQYATEKIVGVKDYGTAKFHDITDYSSEKMYMARDVSLEKLNMVKDKSCEKLHEALASETGQHVLGKIDGALTVAESYVDHYLPENRDEEKPVDPEPMVEVDEATAKSKPVIIYSKTKDRLYSRALSKLQNVQDHSRETLERLNFTVNLIEYAKTNLNTVNEHVTRTVQAARDKGHHWWDEIQREEEEVEKGTIETHTMEDQVLSVARNLTKKLRQSLHSLNEKSVPEHLRDQFAAAKQYSTELAGSFFVAKKFEDLNDVVMTKAKDQADYIKETMSHLAKVAVDNWPLNQVTPDFVIDELGNTDDEMDDEDESTVTK